MDNKIDLIRDHYTFYASFYDAAMLLPKKDRLAYYDAICTYGLRGQEPENLKGAALVAFKLVAPVLNAGRKKAQNGRNGGKSGGKKETQNTDDREDD